MHSCLVATYGNRTRLQVWIIAQGPGGVDERYFALHAIGICVHPLAAEQIRDNDTHGWLRERDQNGLLFLKRWIEKESELVAGLPADIGNIFDMAPVSCRGLDFLWFSSHSLPLCFLPLS